MTFTEYFRNSHFILNYFYDLLNSTQELSRTAQNVNGLLVKQNFITDTNNNINNNNASKLQQ